MLINGIYTFYLLWHLHIQISFSNKVVTITRTGLLICEKAGHGHEGAGVYVLNGVGRTVNVLEA